MAKNYRPNEGATSVTSRRRALVSVPVWAELDDATIGALVRAYASMGDAVMFGSSADRAVASIRVYRGGKSYSVYFRALKDLPDALDRLSRYMPSMEVFSAPTSASPLVLQVKGHSVEGVPDWYNSPPVAQADNSAEAKKRLHDRVQALAKRMKR